MVQRDEYLVSTVDTDALVLQHQGISSHRAEYALMRFQVFMGKKLVVSLDHIFSRNLAMPVKSTPLQVRLLQIRQRGKS